MINGVNTVDFTFAKDSKPTTISTALPQARSELITVFQYAYAKPEITMSAARNLAKTNEMEPPGLERVHVQRLQTHTQLRNNKWTYQNFYSNAATTAAMDTVIDATYKTQYNHNNNNNNNKNSSNNNINNTNNNNSNNINKNIIENKSALIKCNNDEQLRQQQLLLQQQQQQQQQQQPKQQPQQQQQLNCGVVSQMTHVRVGEPKQNYSDTFMITGTGVDDKIITLGEGGNIGNVRPDYYRTKDQENAFRCIEDVHNYAKLKRYGANSNESSDGSTRDFDDDDDDDEEEDDDDEVEPIGADGVNAAMTANLTNDFQVQMPTNLVNPNKTHVLSVGAGHLQPKSMLAKNFIKTPSKFSSTEDADAIVDVETVVGESEQQLMHSPPAHHARRPMNAFLIFCKRHRAIVKDRYKSLENRAITKILGDWWASLDGDEKECFTKLAQQNKDAFFSAHPNFKWYKLPAPPLRTLSTRPSNAERTLEDHDEHEQQANELQRSNSKTQAGGFFKLADETQMGELNSLMNERNKNECPLQKALGETTHFLSAHMPSYAGGTETNDELNDKRNIKRRAITENGFSSNSSEDDLLPKKSSRSCKGKIYQELVSSGQIAPIAKKTRSTKAAVNDFHGADFNYAAMQTHASAHEGFNAAAYLHAMDIRSNKAKRTVSESDAAQHFGEQFDLEEKIKQLPALSLDAYLQRKRNTKKKKKFTARKRTSNSVSLPITDHQLQQHRPLIMAAAPTKSEIRNFVQQQAVGSQKRKARKESITRRDVSAIENEVASLMPHASNYNEPSNGNFYYSENPCSVNVVAASRVAATTPNAANNGDQSRAYSSNYADSITSTSDLFILAEVAAKRTELTNSTN